MRYVVESGQYRTVLDRKSPKEAAQDAINLWRLKKNKPTLAKLLVIVNSEKQELFMSTETLLESSPC
jgi:hypothetical protein